MHAIIFLLSMEIILKRTKIEGGICGHDHMGVGFTTTYLISAYHHY